MAKSHGIMGHLPCAPSSHIIPETVFFFFKYSVTRILQLNKLCLHMLNAQVTGYKFLLCCYWGDFSPPKPSLQELGVPLMSIWGLSVASQWYPSTVTQTELKHWSLPLPWHRMFYCLWEWDLEQIAKSVKNGLVLTHSHILNYMLKITNDC